MTVFHRQFFVQPYILKTDTTIKHKDKNGLTLLLLCILFSTNAFCQIKHLPAKIKKAMPAVVSLVGSNKKVFPNSATGFFIDEKGTCVTNYHVIDEMDFVQIVTSWGQVYKPDSVLIRNKKLDLAVFSVKNPEGEKFPFVELSEKKVEIGEPVFNIGNPQRCNWTVSTGIISAKRLKDPYVVAGKEMLQTNAACSEGSSGSPLFNSNGKVIGVLNKKETTAEAICYAIPVSYLKGLSNDSVSIVPYAFTKEAELIHDFEMGISSVKDLELKEKYDEALEELKTMESKYAKQLPERQQIDLYREIADCYYNLKNYVKAYEYYDYVYTGLRPFLLTAYSDSIAWKKTFESDPELHKTVFTSLFQTALCQFQLKMYTQSDTLLSIAISEAVDGLSMLPGHSEYYVLYLREMFVSRALCKIMLQDLDGACLELMQALKFGNTNAQKMMDEYCQLKEK